MKQTSKLLLGLILLTLVQAAFAQKKLPILKANTNQVNIREGKFTYKGAWTISPQVKPDVFVANPFAGEKQITFYTDIDSLTFNVKPNKKYNFIIRQIGKESAYTQISTFTAEKPSLEPKVFYSRINPDNDSETDSLDFYIGKDNRIHLKGSINGSENLDFIYDTGASSSVITSSLINTKVKMALDGDAQNTGADGVSNLKTSSKNKLEIGNLIWNKVFFLSIDYKNMPFDAVLGWKTFENKIVEIDYEKQKLTLHDKMPDLSAEYSKLEFRFIDGIHYIKCKLLVNGKESETWFNFDTGSNGTLSIGQKFASENKLTGAMKKIGISKSIGSAGIEFDNDQVLLPKLKLGNYEMYQISMSIQKTTPKETGIRENIGNSILKRFNTIIDFQNGFIYLKPNTLFYSPIYNTK